jgi:antitoxin CcdA
MLGPWSQSSIWVSSEVEAGQQPFPILTHMRMRMYTAHMICEEPALYNRLAAKKPTNVTVNSDLLREARAIGINLSAVLEEALIELLRQRRREKWIEENKAAIDSYNSCVREHGTFSDGLRSF